MPNQHAFARSFSGNKTGQEGLTKLEYFTARAMQGILASDANHPLPAKLAADAISYAACVLLELAKIRRDAGLKEES